MDLYPSALTWTLFFFFGGIYIFSVLILYLYGLYYYVVIYLYRKYQKKNDFVLPPLSAKKLPSNLPFVTIQLPIYNEYYVVDRLIASIISIVWLKEKLEIQVLDDSTDETSQKLKSLIHYHKKQGVSISYIHRNHREGYKSGALREGLHRSKGELIAIFDADFLPKEDFLLQTVPYFSNPRIGMVQTRWGHINTKDSLITKSTSLGIDGHFVLEQTARNKNKMWLQFNGTGGIWRKSCILEAGNWQHDTLTEDIDLSYRAEMAGWEFQYLPQVICPSEIPSTMNALKQQQFRWAKGSTQTGLKLYKRILRSDISWKIKLDSIIHIFGYSRSLFILLNILFALPCVLIIQKLPLIPFFSSSVEFSTFFMIFFLHIYIAPSLFYIYAQKVSHSNWIQRSLWFFPLILIGIGLSINNTKAWLEAVLGIQSPFQRTPKTGNSGSKHKNSFPIRYLADKSDLLIWLEIFLGFYCLASSYYTMKHGSFFLFFPVSTALYGLGFFYVALTSIWERYININKSLKTT